MITFIFLVLLGIWSRVNVSSELRPMLYQSLLELLSDTEDVAVRLAACDALNMTIDDFNFDACHFAPYVQSVFALLFALLKEADECDTKVTELVFELTNYLNFHLTKCIILDAYINGFDIDCGA